MFSALVEQNMVGLLFHGQIYYYTFRPIEAGSELMGKCLTPHQLSLWHVAISVWYGREYGMSLRIPNADKANGPVAPENYDMYDEQNRWIGKPVLTYDDNKHDQLKETNPNVEDLTGLQDAEPTTVAD